MLKMSVEIDEKLVSKAMRLSHKKTKKELVNYALEELTNRLERKRILDIEGKIEWTGNLAKMRKDRR